MMKKCRYVFEKMRLIYMQPITYVLWMLNLGFMIIYQKCNNITSLQEYCGIFWMDYYLWMIMIPLITATHRIGIFNVSYFSLSRCMNIKAHIRTDMIVMIVSTFFFVITGIFVPIGLIHIYEPCLLDISYSKQMILFMFVITRYSLIAILAQIVIYILYHCVAKIQQNSFCVPAMPFVLFIVSSIPAMFFSENKFVLEVFNYSAGVIAYEEEMTFNYIISVNIHVFFQILLAVGMLYSMKNHMEFLEYENKTA